MAFVAPPARNAASSAGNASGSGAGPARASHLATMLEVYTTASGAAQQQAVTQLEEFLFRNVPKRMDAEYIRDGEVKLRR